MVSRYWPKTHALWPMDPEMGVCNRCKDAPDMEDRHRATSWQCQGCGTWMHQSHMPGDTVCTGEELVYELSPSEPITDRYGRSYPAGVYTQAERVEIKELIRRENRAIADHAQGAEINLTAVLVSVAARRRDISRAARKRLAEPRPRLPL